MQPHSVKDSVTVRKEENECVGTSLESNLDKIRKEPVGMSSLTSSSSASEDDSDETHDGDDQTNGDASKQMVLYDPTANGTGEIEPVPQPFLYNRAPFGRYSGPNVQSRVFPSVGAFTVQCANCFKWRLIPTKEKYEEIREHVLENPFICEKAREWRPDISCDDPTDISQDGSRLWAIDKPNIAQAPPGWQRLLHIRAEGSTKFADVYYIAPSGKKLRSMVEIQKYLSEHPEYVRDGVTLSQFSFQTPKPLQENYVRKRVPRMNTSHDAPKGLEPTEVKPISWVGPDNITDLQLGRPALPTAPIEASFSDLNPRPVKRARTAPKQMYRSSTPISIEPKFRAEEQEPGQSRNSS